MEQMLAAVKVQFEKLVNDFLLDDFGFDESDVKIVFSGGRGYHAHVTSEKVLGLNSHERREIVDYITKPNMDMDFLIDKQIFDSKSFQGHDSKKYILRLYPADTPGWKGKLTNSVMKFLDSTENMSKEELIDKFTSYSGIGEKTASQIYKSMYLGKPGYRGIDKIRKDLNLEPFSEDSLRNAFINHILKEMTVDLGGETDEPVTTDTKRLIRLPGSLHGKSSLVVRKMSVAELGDFQPLRDSIWAGFDGPSVKVIGTADHEVKLGGETFKVTKDAEFELPEHAALMFLCQKKCDIRI
jgi:DNA primase small subunit